MESQATNRHRPIDRGIRALALTLAVTIAGTLAAGCTQTRSFVGGDLAPRSGDAARVLLMPLDVELAEFTAAGLVEPKAAWTSVAEANVDRSLAALLHERGADLVRYRSPDGTGPAEDPHAQLIELHETVGLSILMHQYNSLLLLPTKEDNFDWSLGVEAARLRSGCDCDYALFVYFRDSFSSDGRVAMIVLGALGGTAVTGGIQVGFASLVDLRDGDIVWFNRLIRQTGDLRQPDGARHAAELLLSEFPL